MPGLTVVIPAYNAAGSLGDTLAALDAQTIGRHAFAVIVVDDGSADDTADVAARFGAAVIRQPNAGPAAARNAGARAAADCDILVFTDADCAPAPDFLARLIAPLADPAVSGVQGAYRTRQTALLARFAQLEFEDRYASVSRRPTIDLVATYAAAYRKAVFDAAGGFDPSFRVADNEDTELSYRLTAAGHRLVFAPDALVSHRHPASLVRYLRIKARRACWRFRACREHPAGHPGADRAGRPVRPGAAAVAGVPGRRPPGRSGPGRAVRQRHPLCPVCRPARPAGGCPGPGHHRCPVPGLCRRPGLGHRDRPGRRQPETNDAIPGRTSNGNDRMPTRTIEKIENRD
jgi:GT2 family glycosyltransferase